MNTSHELCTFAGTELSATFETADIGSDDVSLFVRDSRVIANGTGATFTVSIGHREYHNGAITYSTPVSAESTGKHSHRAKGRYIRALVTTAGAFVDATAVYVTLKNGGRR